tara:strand:+ start:232 stop:516 length:285 start_codon:yes stop_codon:yes gene_type:complete
MARFHNINGEHVAFTPEEEAERDAEEALWEDGKNDREMAIIRTERNKLLQNCDWTQSRDLTLSNDEAWKLYRSQLRDFPENVDLNNIEWPKEPA